MTREGRLGVPHHVRFIGKQRREAVLPTTGRDTSNLEAGCKTRSCLHQHQWTPVKRRQVKPGVSQIKISIYTAARRPASSVTCGQCQPSGRQEGPCWPRNTPQNTQQNKVILFQQRGTLLSWEGVNKGSVLFTCSTCDMTQCLYQHIFNAGILVLISGQAQCRAFLQLKLSQQQHLSVGLCLRMYHPEKNDCVLF